MLAQALAKECQASFILLKASTILSKWYGDTNKLIAAVWSLAHKIQPTVIFIGGWVGGRAGAWVGGWARGWVGGSVCVVSGERLRLWWACARVPGLRTRRSTPPPTELHPPPRTPTLTCADEVDSLLGHRRSVEHEATTAMKTEFMQLWEGFETGHANIVVGGGERRGVGWWGGGGGGVHAAVGGV